jgi:hypothetical protein
MSAGVTPLAKNRKGRAAVRAKVLATEQQKQKLVSFRAIAQGRLVVLFRH